MVAADLLQAGLIFAAALAVEALHPARRERCWRGIAFNVAAASAFLGLTALLVPPLSHLLEPVRSQLALHIPVRFPDGVAGSILQTLAFFAVFDFFYYWFHRAQHAFGWLWAQHRFHHQERWLNVTTTHRHHFTEELLRQFAVYLPMGILFDFKPVTVTWLWTTFTLWGYWIHLNLRADLGRATRWISGPHFHRCHHELDAPAGNFAAFFPMWDALFGTYRAPQRGVYPPVGVTGDGDGNNAYDALARPFVEWSHGLARLVRRPAAH
jgi:sterol desaturase/sphingolipid hydroxylase (fatty acid hydroxylase superfamily)